MDGPPQCEFVSDDLVVRLDVTFPAQLSRITPVVESVMRVVTESGCAPGSELEIELAVQEALANAVRHGCRNDPDKKVRCVVACDPDRGMIIVVKDEGEGFDPSRVPNPLVGENVFAHHGRGIYLINQLMDEVRFAGNGTEIHMVKRVRKSPGESDPPAA
jgi:serine/threonine-protein kinase RsbW